MPQLSINEKILYLFLFLAMVLSWLSIVDNYAYDLNTQGLKNTTAAFVVLKAFDSLITLAKDFPVIGSLFLPYKDFLDRMSFVMLMSLLSLGLQKVILVAMHSFIVNFLLSLNILVILADAFKKFLAESTKTKLMKLVLLLLFIRFAIPILSFAVVSLQTGSDAMYSEAHQQRIEKLQEKLININALTEEREDAKADRENKIEVLKNQLSDLEDSKKELETRIEYIRTASKNDLNALVDHFIMETKDSESVIKKVNLVKDKISKLDNEIKGVEQKLNELEDASFLDGISERISEKIKITMANINMLIEEMIDVFLTSVILFFFINVFFPIIFLWSLYKLIDFSLSTSFAPKLEATIAPSNELKEKQHLQIKT